MERRYYTFYWHEAGQDCNGNYGPPITEPGWSVVSALARHDGDYDSGIKACPKWFQERVQKIVQEHLRENGGCSQGCDLADNACMAPLQHYIADTCGWGSGFSFYGEDDWKNEQENTECSHDALLAMEAEERSLSSFDRAWLKKIHEFDNE